ncbi:feruloyl-CoA synthase [Burkholderia anthina]|uniref:feruloyl-CoA synthase n=2 Tax=Burkholderia TaxID=32008 RepID=UPI001FC8B47D|nr:feruloyl-CoA synthase [Burkholderia anthina]
MNSMHNLPGKIWANFTSSELALAAPNIERIDSPDGSFILRPRVPLRPHARCIGEWLEHWCLHTPERVFLAERTADGADWRRLTYAQVRAEVGAVAQGLLDMQITPAAPIAILSDNSVDGALLMLAAMHVGLPVSFLSPAYARATRDYGNLRALLHVLEPGLMYADDGAIYASAMQAIETPCPLVFSRNVPASAMDLESLRKTRETAEVTEAFARVTPDTHAKYLLTSGSTGTPKVVINTHRMLCANQEAIAQVWPFVDRAAPLVVDWLPWSHTFGTNHNFNMILRNGGSLFIDDGRPAPVLIEKSVRNLSECSPTLYFNVPRGFDALLPYLEQDESFAGKFFTELQAIFFAGAALPKPLWDRLKALAQCHRETPLFFSSAWGATETSPVVTSLHFHYPEPGNLGVPVPGTEMKFVPNGGKFEMRVRGQQVFPGYRKAPELTEKAFDEEGFYMIGDAGRLADPSDPNVGILFDGRVSEDFKLTTGTWVSVGTLRLRAVAALAPYAQDVVVAGHDRDEIGLLIFPSPALRTLAGDNTNAMSGVQLAECEEARCQIATALAVLNKGHGSSGRVACTLILDSPPCEDIGEITDKGYVNQRQVLKLRAHEVERLFGGGASVIYPATH